MISCAILVRKPRAVVVATASDPDCSLRHRYKGPHMLEVRLLGRFEVRLDGELIDLASRPAQSLFAYLALNPNLPHRRERLAGLLWPDTSDANARNSLRHALWTLRRALGADGQYPLAHHLTITQTRKSHLFTPLT